MSESDKTMLRVMGGIAIADLLFIALCMGKYLAS